MVGESDGVVMDGRNIAFDIYSENIKTGRVEIKDGVLVKNECYSDRFYAQPFKNVKTAFDMCEMLEGRVFKPERPEAEELLKIMGIPRYNVYDILKFTHGATTDDRIWFKFSFDREGLCWEDVRPPRNWND